MNMMNGLIDEARELFETEGKVYNYIGLYNRIRASGTQLKVQNGLIISNENFDYLAAYLTVTCFAVSVPIIFLPADYGQLESEYYKRKNTSEASIDICIIVGQAITLTSSFGDLNVSDDQAVSEIVDRYLGLVDMFRAISDSVLVANFPIVSGAFFGVSSNAPRSVSRRVQMTNVLLEQKCRSIVNCDVVDLFTLVTDVGLKNWHNHRDWYTARIPGGAKYGVLMAGLFIPFLRKKSGRIYKVLALDFDNTLWGGVAGEDGVEGVKVGGGYPGNIYEVFQNHVKGLRERGVILVAASKNNLSDVELIFDNRSDMKLSLSDFSAVKVDWNEKFSNMKDAALELNLGLDSFVFVDDNPLEIDKVRVVGAGVECILMPQPSEDFSEFYRNLYSYFPLADVTEEDKLRSEMYSIQRERDNLRDKVESVHDYIRSIEPIISMSLADDSTLDRVVQLHEKTNQFNLTTERFGAKDIQAFINNDIKRVYVFSLADKFGDLGIISSSIIDVDVSLGEARIDSFLMSCRAMGRKAEYSILSLIITALKKEGLRTVIGLYKATEKNLPASDFYDKFGFDVADDDLLLKRKTYKISTNFSCTKQFIEDLGVKVNGRI